MSLFVLVLKQFDIILPVGKEKEKSSTDFKCYLTIKTYLIPSDPTRSIPMAGCVGRLDGFPVEDSSTICWLSSPSNMNNN